MSSSDDVADELAALLDGDFADEGSIADSDASERRRVVSTSSRDSRLGRSRTHAISQSQERLTLIWSGLLFLSFFLPVVVLYEPESSGAPGVMGSLGDTYYGASSFMPIGLLGLLVALPVPIALLAERGRLSADSVPSGSPIVLYAALATFVLVALPTALLGGVFSLLPIWIIPSLAAKFGFRVDLGPGAWAALVCSAALVFVTASAIPGEQLERTRLSWLSRSSSANGRAIGALAGLLVVSAGLRVIDWVKVDGKIDLIAPELGKVGVFHHSGNGGVPAALLPGVSGVQLGALAILGLSIVLLWTRDGVGGPLLAVLGAWGSFACAGVVAALNASWGRELHLDLGPIASIKKFRVDAVVESVQPSVWLTMVAGLVAVAVAITCLENQRHRAG